MQHPEGVHPIGCSQHQLSDARTTSHSDRKPTERRSKTTCLEDPHEPDERNRAQGRKRQHRAQVCTCELKPGSHRSGRQESCKHVREEGQCDAPLKGKSTQSSPLTAAGRHRLGLMTQQAAPSTPAESRRTREAAPEALRHTHRANPASQRETADWLRLMRLHYAVSAQKKKIVGVAAHS